MVKFESLYVAFFFIHIMALPHLCQPPQYANVILLSHYTSQFFFDFRSLLVQSAPTIAGTLQTNTNYNTVFVSG